MAEPHKTQTKKSKPESLNDQILRGLNSPLQENALKTVQKVQKEQIEEAMKVHQVPAEHILQSLGIPLSTKQDQTTFQSQNTPQSQQSTPVPMQANGQQILASLLQQQQPQQESQGQSIEQQAQKLAQPSTGIIGKIFDMFGGLDARETKLRILKQSQAIQNGSMSKSDIAQMQYKDKKENAVLIADAMESGDQLADFKGLYGLAGPVKAELEKRRVDVAKLQLEATAETKLAQTLNNPQQVRLRQSIDSVVHGLDELDSLNDQFERTGVKAFNKAQLETYANGAGTPEQQELAQRFKTQIIGLQDEFGNVVMGGNSPTDRALELAGKIFNSNFNNTTIRGTTKQARRLLNMRKHAIENVGAVNDRDNNTKSSESTSSGKTVTLPSGKTITLGQ